MRYTHVSRVLGKNENPKAFGFVEHEAKTAAREGQLAATERARKLFSFSGPGL